MKKSKLLAILASVIIIIVMVAIVYPNYFTSNAVSSQGLTNEATTISVDPTTIELSGAIGQTVQVNVNVSDVQDLWGWEIDNITFNSKVLNLTQVEEGSFLKSSSSTFFISTGNSASGNGGVIASTVCAFSQNTTVSGSGVLLSLKFDVLSEGSSQITLSSAKLYSSSQISPADGEETGWHQSINSTIVNGNVKIDKVT